MTSLGHMRPCLRHQFSFLASHAVHHVFLHARLYPSSLQGSTHPDPWWAGSFTSFLQTLVATTPRYVPTPSHRPLVWWLTFLKLPKKQCGTESQCPTQSWQSLAVSRALLSQCSGPFPNVNRLMLSSALLCHPP